MFEQRWAGLGTAVLGPATFGLIIRLPIWGRKVPSKIPQLGELLSGENRDDVFTGREPQIWLAPQSILSELSAPLHNGPLNQEQT